MKRSSASLCVQLLVLIFLVAITNQSPAYSQEDLARLTNFSIDGLVRFRTREEAESRRDKLIAAIWPNGLPQTRPALSQVSTNTPEIVSIDKSLIDSAWLMDVNVSQLDWHALIYVVRPKASDSSRIAIVHGGHMREGPEHYLDSGLSDAANHLLQAGYTVALIQMPLVGWNQDSTLTLAGQSVMITKRGSAGHDQLFQLVEPHLGAGTMRLFLEPITQVINELVATAATPTRILMIGLSGGGWTTHLYAALDTRIDVSVPVAGAYPLYARPFSRGSRGDAEQEYAPIFGEEDSDGDGILDQATGLASWLEVFALGSLSPDPNRPRKQIQVLNLYDSCCFHGAAYESYAEALTKRVQSLGTGSWQVYIDDSHRDHLISTRAIQDVLDKVRK